MKICGPFCRCRIASCKCRYGILQCEYVYGEREAVMKQKTIEERFYHTYGFGVVLMILVSVGITLYYSIAWQQRQMDESISGMAAVLAQMPMIVDTLEGREDSEELIEYLEHVRSSVENLDVITVCDTDSIRLYHPDKSRIGQKFVGGDEAEVLWGAQPYITDGTGTLGQQRRAFYPVKNESGRIIGFVMASVLTESIRQVRNQILLVYGVLLLVLLGVGAALARHTMGYLKRLLMGFKPEEFVTRYVERNEVLDTLDEGLFAVNPEGEVILMNHSAREMLGVDDGRQVEGEKLTALYPETKLLEVMKTGQAQYNATMVLGGNHILTSRIPLMENGHIAGAISIFRNKTEVMKLANELTGARDMLETLRAFNHEFMNKLHVILGYLQLGEHEKAMDYITNTTLVSSEAVREVTNQVTVSHLSALLIGKMMRASELGIRLRLKHGSHCSAETLLFPVDGYVTIAGNLLENAIEELNAHRYPVKQIELGIYCDEQGTVITCEDTGGGISEEIRENIFDQGVSTKGEGRGTGLSLVMSLVRQYGGEIAVETESGEGTCITVSFVAQQTDSGKGGDLCIG